MDIATPIGIVLAIGILIYAAILEGVLDSLIKAGSMMIVLGGSLGVLLFRSKLSEFMNMFSKVILKTLFAGVDKPVDLIEQLVEMANIARKDGLIALEGQDIKNNFLSKGIGLLVDSTPPEIIENSLRNELDMMKSRHESAAMGWRSWADIAPAMGMIGTLIGLVGMLSAMDDPKSIGPAMAVALLTTLYGAFIANVIAKPIAEKLENYSQDEAENCELIIEGIMGIQNSMNPRSMADLLATRLPPGDRSALEGL